MTVTPPPNAVPGPRPGVAATSAAPSATVQPSLGELVSEASQHVSTLVRSEIELAKLELRSSVKNAGVGAVSFVLAAAVLIFSLFFGFFALAEGIAALGLDRWLAFLIVFGVQLLLVGGLVFLGIRKVKRVKAPERTISTSKETVAYLRSHA